MSISQGFAKGVAGTVLLPIFSFFPLSSAFFPFHLQKKKREETPFTRPILRNPEFLQHGVCHKDDCVQLHVVKSAGPPKQVNSALRC